MRENEPRDMPPEVPIAEILRKWFLAMAALFGMALILLGVYFASQLFGLAYAALTDPDRFGPVLEKWSEFFGGQQPVIDVNNGQVKISSRLFAFLALGGCVVVMLWLALGVITAGARIVYWMGTDANAIRRVLGHVFGPSVIKVVREPNLKAPRPFERSNSDRGE